MTHYEVIEVSYPAGERNERFLAVVEPADTDQCSCTCGNINGIKPSNYGGPQAWTAVQ